MEIHPSIKSFITPEFQNIGPFEKLCMQQSGVLKQLIVQLLLFKYTMYFK